MPKFIFNKLIRDKLFDVMLKDNIDIVSQDLSIEQFNFALKQKLLEEAHEVINASKSSDMIEELADVLEVIHTLCHTNNINIVDVEEVRKNKGQAKGYFTPQSYIIHVNLPSTAKFNFYLNYYRNAPEKYPEINE